MERERPRFEGVMSWPDRVKIACGQIARVCGGGEVICMRGRRNLPRSSSLKLASSRQLDNFRAWAIPDAFD